MSARAGLTRQQALERLERHCAVVGLTLDEAIAEKADELSIRAFLRCVPDEGIKRSRVVEYVTEVLDRAPERDLLTRLEAEARGPRLDDEGYLQLEKVQCGRCALCGALLLTSVRPQIDHVVPVALGGKSHVTNYQLLCQQCNLGKSKLIGWIMGAPFLEVGVGCKLRFCVLTRFRGRCSIVDCTETSRTTSLEVIPVIPAQRGGRMIFDNLRTMCTQHASAQRKAWKDEAVRKLQYGTWGRNAWTSR